MMKSPLDSEVRSADMLNRRHASAASVVSVLNVADYGRTIHDRALRRDLIAIGEDVVNRAHDYELGSDALNQIEMAEENLYQLATTGDYEGDFTPFNTALREAINIAEAAYKRDGNLAGVATHLLDLDKQLGGLHSSDLLILAGRAARCLLQADDVGISGGEGA